jgi:cell pole-organizing protein PopZ
MNNANRRQEEDMTMDEILSSIRRYVSGDTQEMVVAEERPRDVPFSNTSSYAHDDPYQNVSKSPDVVRLTSAFEVPHTKQTPPVFAEQPTYDLHQETRSVNKNPFEKLSEIVNNTPPSQTEPTPASLNLDQVFRKMAEDMIQQWLDKNMPAITENLVQKEIQRLTGRSL